MLSDKKIMQYGSHFFLVWFSSCTLTVSFQRMFRKQDLLVQPKQVMFYCIFTMPNYAKLSPTVSILIICLSPTVSSTLAILVWFSFMFKYRSSLLILYTASCTYVFFVCVFAQWLVSQPYHVAIHCYLGLNYNSLLICCTQVL